MGLFFFNQGISDEDRVKLLELHGNLGGNNKILERDIMEKDKEVGKPVVIYGTVEVGLSHLETLEEIGRIIQEPPHYEGRLG